RQNFRKLTRASPRNVSMPSNPVAHALMRAVSTLVSIPVLATALLLAQEPPAIKVYVGLVNVAFTARDAQGRLVTDLTRDEIEVLEDGARQPVQFFGRSGDLPLEFAVLLDMSGSQEHFAHAHRDDLHAFATKALTPADKAMLVCFGDHIRIATDYTASSTT